MHNWTWEILMIVQLQDTALWLGTVMEVFTWLGYPQAYMVIIAIIYWGFDRKLGVRMAIFLPFCASLNSILKQAFHAPRPYWVDQKIIAMHADSGFGMPSGHAQSSTVWLLAGAYLKKSWFWILAIIVTGMVGLSRVYLGVHFPTQIVLGWIAGIVLLVLYLLYESRVLEWFTKKKITEQMILLSGCTFGLILLGVFFLIILGSWEMPPEWIENASGYITINKTVLESYGLASVFGNAGSFLGVTMGAVLISHKGNFITAGFWWKVALRILTGLIVLAALFLGMQLFEPGNAHPVVNALWRFFGFYLISITALWLLPSLFGKMGLLKFR